LRSRHQRAKRRESLVRRPIAEQVARSIEETWPKELVDAAGALPDFPSLKAIRKGYGKDARRETLKGPS